MKTDDLSARGQGMPEEALAATDRGLLVVMLVMPLRSEDGVANIAPKRP